MERLITAQIRHWEPITVNDFFTGRRYLPAEEIKVRLIYNQFGTPVIYTHDELHQLDFLSHFTDLKGVDILPGTVLYINRRKAVLNPFGLSDGFAYQLGDISDTTIDFDSPQLEVITDNVGTL